MVVKEFNLASSEKQDEILSKTSVDFGSLVPVSGRSNTNSRHSILNITGSGFVIVYLKNTTDGSLTRGIKIEIDGTVVAHDTVPVGAGKTIHFISSVGTSMGYRWGTRDFTIASLPFFGFKESFKVIMDPGTIDIHAYAYAHVAV